MSRPVQSNTPVASAADADLITKPLGAARRLNWTETWSALFPDPASRTRLKATTSFFAPNSWTVWPFHAGLRIPDFPVFALSSCCVTLSSPVLAHTAVTGPAADMKRVDGAED